MGSNFFIASSRLLDGIAKSGSSRLGPCGSQEGIEFHHNYNEMPPDPPKTRYWWELGEAERCLRQVESDDMGKFVKVLLVANLFLWIYFWIAFAQASYPFRPDPLGHPAGTGYTFWGHSIAVVESGLMYPFFRVVFYVEFPSFLLVTLVARMFSPHLLLNGFFAGISGGGWLLLAVMALSFLQWYFIGWSAQKLWHRWSGHPAPLQIL